jgi:NifU-like protein involved in Fe-S cluster formation
LELSAQLCDHFFNPRNVGDAGEPSFTGRSASLSCGALVRFSIQVDEAHLISQARFRAAGCNVLIASGSFVTEQIRGMTTAEAAAFGQDAVRNPENASSSRATRCSMRYANTVTLHAMIGRVTKR